MKKNIMLFYILGMGMIASAQTNTFPSSGNVGIGTISPDTKFHIRGSNHMLKVENTDISSNQYSQMNLKAGTADNYIWTNNQNSSGFYGGSSALNIYTGQDSPIAFFTNGSNERMRIDGAGNIGIGTISPEGKFHVAGDILSGGIGNAGKIVLARPSDGALVGAISNENTTGLRISTVGGSGSSYITFQTAAVTDALRIIDNGNIGIGTTDPQGYKLAVNGNMIAESVKVKLHSNWPDYVFHKAYPLKPLSEVENYIHTNNHLPDIPSAVEVKEQGLNLGEMNAKLLQKIEELTLYIIEQNKRIERLEGAKK